MGDMYCTTDKTVHNYVTLDLYTWMSYRSKVTQ